MACCSSPLSAISELRVGRACSCSSASCLYTSSRKLGAERSSGGARARLGRSPRPNSSSISCSTTCRSCRVIEWCITVWSTPLSMYNPDRAASAAATNRTQLAYRHAVLEPDMFDALWPVRLRTQLARPLDWRVRRPRYSRRVQPAPQPLNLPAQGGPLWAADRLGRDLPSR